ncbi:hypothetical protein SCUP515_09596 [Seiridium cupressi]
MAKAIDALIEGFKDSGIPVLEPKEPTYRDYEKAVVTSNLLFRFTRPPCVLKPESTEHVQKVVEQARLAKIPITIRYKGHSYAGHSTAIEKETILVDLRSMNTVQLDMKSQIVTIGAGCHMWVCNLRQNVPDVVSFNVYFDGSQKEFERLIDDNIETDEVDKQLKRRILPEPSTPIVSKSRTMSTRSPLCMDVTWIHAGGQAGKKMGPTESAFYWRDTVYHCYIEVLWKDKWMEKAMRRFMWKLKKQFRPYSIQGEAAHELRKIKEIWDKDNYFKWQQQVKLPKDVTEKGDDVDGINDEEDTDGIASKQWKPYVWKHHESEDASANLEALWDLET